MKININEILSIYEEKQVDDFLKKYTGLTLNEKNLKLADINKNYKCLGDSVSNGSSVGQLTKGEKGVVERITNAIDSVIEKEKSIHGPVSPKNSEAVIKRAFPKYHYNKQLIRNQEANRSYAKDAEGKVLLVVNDGSNSKKPTLDIMDSGTGLNAEEFPDTILSVHNGNKISQDKSYLIGAFGQGGSTSLPFAYATLILSKKNGSISFTIIKKVEVYESKNLVYVYLHFDGIVPGLITNNYIAKYSYLNDFIFKNESGTLVRMIETDIAKRFRDNDVTKPGMLSDYLNTELFNVGLPVKIIENRKNYIENADKQNRHIYGSFMKLQTWKKYVKREYSGTLNIEYKYQNYKIDYYVLLPTDEGKWGSEIECKKVFEQFNVYLNPIIYTVNGQTVATERYTKLSNSGLNFLKYRLLVVIDLDVLGSDKYRFFTTDRARIVYRDETKGFLDKVILSLSKQQNLININNIIGDKSVSSAINKEIIDDISKEVKSQFTKYLKSGSIVKGSNGHHYEPENEEIFNNEITSLEITSKKREFYKDENATFIVTTHAQKHINKEAVIYMYINDKAFYNYQNNIMNGRIQYQINARSLKPGKYSICFEYFNGNNSMTSKSEEFFVIDKFSPSKLRNSSTKNLDIKVNIIDEATTICDIAKDELRKIITINLCLDTDQMRSEIYGLSSSSDNVSKIKTDIIKPLSLFSLFYEKQYNNIESDEEKNRLILSFIKSYISSNKKI